jgi:hypothetical protein
MTIESPWCDTDVTRSEQLSQHVSQPIAVIGHASVVQANPVHSHPIASESAEGGFRFRLSDATQIKPVLPSRRVRRFAISHRDHHDLKARPNGLLHQAPGAEDFVVGMGGHDDEALEARSGSPVHNREAPKLAKAVPGQPVALLSAGVLAVDD